MDPGAPEVTVVDWTRYLGFRGRTPSFPQVHSTECGAACLGIALAHHGCWVGMDELRSRCGVNRDGCTARDLQLAAEHYGLRATGWRREPHQLRRLRLPAILFWEFDHFVVLEGIRGGKYLLNDPANGYRTVSHEHFNARFTGIVLELEPGPGFSKRGERPRLRRQLSPWFRRHRLRLLFCALCGLVLVAPGIGLPLLLGAFVDEVLVGGEAAVGAPIVLGVCALAALTFCVTWLQQRSLRDLNVAVSVEQAERFVTKIFRLPVEYFQSRFAGDLAQRTQLIDGIAGAGAVHLSRMLIDLCTCLAFFAVMMALDPLIAASVAVTAAVGLLALRAASRFRLDENHRMRREQGQLAGISNFAARNLYSIRAAGNEDDFFASWSGFQARELAARQRFRELGIVNSSLTTVMTIVGSAVVLGVGGLRVMSGTLSVGELMAGYFIANGFLGPVGGLLLSMDTIHVLDADLRRVSDVLDARDDPSVVAKDGTRASGIATIDGRLRLAGYLELRSVSFGYKPRGRPLLQDFNLSVRPGQRVAIVGPSGSGKSTVALLIAGVCRSWEGEVLFDGRPREEIPHRIFSESVAVVSQQISLFAGSVRDNLTMWNPAVPDELVIGAARDAGIHGDIARRPRNYSAHVEEGGTNFSGGQRQRLEIARALVSRPSLVVLDEATSSLDAVLEAEIDDALRRRGCACVIIAHRLSTVRDCDEIIVLAKGRTIQQGSHDELMRDRAGLYRHLVANR